MKQYGSHSETGKIESILLKSPEAAFISDDVIGSQWKALNYIDRPDYSKSFEEYTGFVELINQYVDEIHYLPEHENTGMDSLYTHDPVVITKKGVILCNMGKKARISEPGAAAVFLESIGIPVLGTITGDGRLEGGDVIWFDDVTVAVGLGYRTNSEGIKQFTELISDFVEEVITVPLPHWNGPEDVLHLMSNISPIDSDLAVVYSRLLTVTFRDWLINRGIQLVEVPDEEYASMGCNVLAVAPRRCIMISGNPVTKSRLEAEGAEVLEYQGEEISRKGEGGPTCLTRPLLRR